MGKQGPCYHCGVTSTPLWRNGPPEKPVLCNACGSRWRTKGSLTNYTPLHARAELVDSEDYKVARVKTILVKKEQKMHKRKSYDIHVEVEGEAPNMDQNFHKVMEEDTSNRSSSGSAISYSESCAHFSAADGSELTGPAQSAVWDSLVPSRKRTCFSRPKQSPVEKLTKELCSILHEQQQSSHFSLSSEEDLLLESGTLMDSFEIGHGGCLLKYSTLDSREEESEASSFSVDKKSLSVSDTYSAVSSLSASSGSKMTGLPSDGNEKAKKFTVQGVQESTKRDKSSQDKLVILQCSKSPLTTVDLRDVVSHEVFTRHMTTEEQHQLLKDLPSLDTVKPPDSLKNMFESPQFLESVSSFQQLLLEGVFDLSSPQMSNEDCRVLKRLALVNLTKAKWIEHYQRLKDAEQNKDIAKNRDVVGSNILNYGIVAPFKRIHHFSNQKFAEAKDTLKSPKLVQKGGNMIITPTRASRANFTCGSLKANNDKDMDMENEAYGFNPRSLFSFPPDRCSSALISLQFSNESSDEDLLFDVPSNASFPQAELLDSHLWKSKNLSDCTGSELL